MATGQQRFFISKIKKGGSMSNYVDKYIDEDGNVDNKLTRLNMLPSEICVNIGPCCVDRIGPGHY